VCDVGPTGEALVVRYTPGQLRKGPGLLNETVTVRTLPTSQAQVEMFPLLWSGEAMIIVRTGEGAAAHFTGHRLPQYGMDVANEASETAKTQTVPDDCDLQEDTPHAFPNDSELGKAESHTSLQSTNGSDLASHTSSDEFVTPPELSPSVLKTAAVVKRSPLGIVGTKAEIAALSTADQALRRLRFKHNSQTMDEWVKKVRRSNSKSIPLMIPSDVSQLGTWIPAHVDGLVELIRALPYPVDFLRGLPLKKILELGHSINSQAQLAVINHHAHDQKISAPIRAHCLKWAKVILACPQGTARWLISDDINRWTKLEQMDGTLTMATTENPVDPDEWGVLNVISILMPKTFKPHPGIGTTLPVERTTLYWSSKDLREVVRVILSTHSWTPMIDRSEVGNQERPRRS
jgi:hypothetical protein